MNIYSNRLIQLRNNKEPKLTQKQIAEILGISYQMYQRYEYEKSEMPARHLIALSEIFDTSADYILGITDEKTPYPRSKKRSK